MNNKETLFNWVFHQRLDGIWEAVKREYYVQFWNGNKDNVLSSVDINMLIELVSKTDGNPNEINKLINK